MFVLLYSVCHFVCQSLSVSSFFSVACGGGLWHHLFVIIPLHMFYVLLFWTSLREREKKQEVFPMASRMYHQNKRRNKIRNLWLWLVCYCLLPTCYFHWLFTLWRRKKHHTHNNNNKKTPMQCLNDFLSKCLMLFHEATSTHQKRRLQLAKFSYIIKKDNSTRLAKQVL